MFKIPTTTSELTEIIQGTIHKMMEHVKNRGKKYINLSLLFYCKYFNYIYLLQGKLIRNQY